MTRPKRNRTPLAEGLESRAAPNLGIDLPASVVYSDPTAPPEPHPGPYPGEGSPIGYPTPVPGGPVGPGLGGRFGRT